MAGSGIRLLRFFQFVDKFFAHNRWGNIDTRVHISSTVFFFFGIIH